MTEISAANAPPVGNRCCAACGAGFSCRPGACWCGSVTLTDEARSRLRAAYADCLCPGCLQAVSVSAAEADGPGTR